MSVLTKEKPVSRHPLNSGRGVEVLSQESEYSLTGRSLTTVIQVRCVRPLGLNALLDRLGVDDDCTYGLFSECKKDLTGSGYLATIHRYNEPLA